MRKSKIVYLLIILLCLATILVCVYYLLGGFNKLDVYEFEGTKRTVIGKHHIGRLPPDDVRGFLLETKSLIDSGRLRGKLTLVEYQNDTIGEDSLHLFIGASFDEIRDVLELPPDYTYEEYETNRVYRVFVTKHPLVVSPGEVWQMIQEKASLDSAQLQPYSFDIYYADGSRFTEGWMDTSSQD